MRMRILFVGFGALSLFSISASAQVDSYSCSATSGGCVNANNSIGDGVYGVGYDAIYGSGTHSGVYGTGSQYGVYGTSSDYGIYGVNTSGSGFGVFGTTASTGSTAVEGYYDGAAGAGTGVGAFAEIGNAINAQADNGIGVNALSQGGHRC